MSVFKVKDNNDQWVVVSAGGIGVPSGGSAGQVLKKTSAADYATGWANPDMMVLATNVSVPTSAWAADSTYTDYGYKATVAITGATSAMIPEAIFGIEDAVSGIFAPACETYNGGIYLYASEIPTATITLPTVILWRGTA